MTLKERYDESVKTDQDIRKAAESLERKKEFFQENGLDPDMVDAAPIRLSYRQKELVTETIGLIPEDRWKQAKLSFNQEDAENELLYRRMQTFFRSEPADRYVRYRWENENIRCGRLLQPVLSTEAGIRRRLEKKVAKAVPGFVNETNAKRANVKSILAEGEQDHVLLEFGTHERHKAVYVLFKDGSLFPVGGCGDVVLDDAHIFFRHGTENGGKKSLEDWLVENLKRINGESSD